MSYEQTIRKMRRELMECEAERVQRVKEFEEQRQELIYRKNRLYELAHDTEYASYRVRETAPDEFSRLHRDIDLYFQRQMSNLGDVTEQLMKQRKPILRILGKSRRI